VLDVARTRRPIQQIFPYAEEKHMKSGSKTKSHDRPDQKRRAGKLDDKNKAADRKSPGHVKGVNRNNTLANWVAGMASTKSRTAHRGNTLADWVRNSS
jgi:hypothetical protein